MAENVHEAVGRHDHEQARSDAYQHVGAQAGRPGQAFALEADGAAEQGGETEARDHFELRKHDISLMNRAIHLSMQ
jgi:hypothetical protein